MACLLAFSQSSIAEIANLVIKGSTTILPIARSIAEKFEHQCENVHQRLARRKNTRIHQLRARPEQGTGHDRGCGIYSTVMTMRQTGKKY